MELETRLTDTDNKIQEKFLRLFNKLDLRGVESFMNLTGTKPSKEVVEEAYSLILSKKEEEYTSPRFDDDPIEKISQWGYQLEYTIKMTGIDIPEEIVQKAYVSFLKQKKRRGYSDTWRGDFSTLKKATGISPNIPESVITELVAEAINKDEFYKIKELSKLNKIKIDRIIYHQIYEVLLIEGDFYSINMLIESSGVKPEFKEDSVLSRYAQYVEEPDIFEKEHHDPKASWMHHMAVQAELSDELIPEGSIMGMPLNKKKSQISDIHNLISLAELSGVPIPKDIIQKAYLISLNGGDSKDLPEKLHKITGVMPSEEVAREGIDLLVKEERISDLIQWQELTKEDIRLSYQEVQGLYALLFNNRDYSEMIMRFYEMTGIKPEEGLVKKAYIILLKSARIDIAEKLVKYSGVQPRLSSKEKAGILKHYLGEFKGIEETEFVKASLEKIGLPSRREMDSEYLRLAKEGDMRGFEMMHTVTGVAPSNKHKEILISNII